MTSVTEPTTGTIVKSDRIGRTRYAAQYKQDVLAAYESSSLSGPDFAKQCGIKYPTFAAWIGARKRSGRQPARNAPAFLVAEVSETSGDAALEIHLPGGAIARASSSDQVRLLAELLRHLA